VHRLLNPLGFAAAQLAVFQGANERPYLTHTGRASNAEKQLTGRGPEGCAENGSAASLLVSHVPHHVRSRSWRRIVALIHILSAWRTRER
jgi:hypothetical protein